MRKLWILPAAATIAAMPSSGQAPPGYALGQPLSESRRVLPPGQSANTWVLHCADDDQKPQGLSLTDRERRAGIMRCWPMVRSAAGEQRSGIAPRVAASVAEELEFIAGRLVRITTSYTIPNGKVPTTISQVEADPRSIEIDRLQR